MMFRRAALDELGSAFDDRFARAQDYDLSLRMAYHFLSDYVDQPLAKWRMNGLAEKPWKRSLEAREVEIKSSVDKIIDTYPDIKSKYSAELQSLNTDLDYSFGVNAWRDGKNGEARTFLSRHLPKRKFAIVYLCTYLMSFDLFYKFRVMFRNLTTGRI